jgi:hypothetical protein
VTKFLILACLTGCVDADEPPPAIASIEPAIGSCEGGELVTIRGVNLNEVDVAIGGVPCVQVASGTQVASCWTTQSTRIDAPLDVVVTNAAGSATLPAGYTYRVPGTTTWDPAGDLERAY